MKTDWVSKRIFGWRRARIREIGLDFLSFSFMMHEDEFLRGRYHGKKLLCFRSIKSVGRVWFLSAAT